LHNAVRGPFTGFLQRQAFLVLTGEDPPALATGMREQQFAVMAKAATA